MKDDTKNIEQQDLFSLTREIDNIKAELSQARAVVRAEIKSNTGWLEVRMDTWRLMTFSLIVVVLIAVGTIAGLYLATIGAFPPPKSPDALKAGGLELQFQQIISAFIPGILFVLTVFMGFVGMKRLQAYDEEIRQARQETRTQMSEAASLQREQFKDIYQKQREFEDKVVSTAKIQANTSVKESLEDQLNYINKSVSEIEKRIETKKIEIENAISEYSWLKAATEKQREALRKGKVSSAGQAHAFITSLMGRGDIATALAIAERAIDDHDVGGAPDDWFNISAQLGAGDQHRHALLACNRGLLQAPTNVDLLSHALQFASKLGQWDVAKDHYEKLLTLDKTAWNWRAFVFASEYLIATNDTNGAIRLSDEFATNIPTDERAYSQVAKIYDKLGQSNQVVEICKKGISAVARTGQISLIYAEALVDLGRYDDALNACDAALVGTSEMQPSTNISAIVWRRGSIFDAKALVSMRDEMSDNIDPAVELTRQAVLNYRAATEMPKALRIFAEQTNTRISVLRTRLAEAGATEEQLLSVFGEEKGTNDGDNATNALEELMRRMGQ